MPVARLCEGRTDIPLSFIEKWLDYGGWCAHQAAMNACQGRNDIPIEVIEKRVQCCY